MFLYACFKGNLQLPQLCGGSNSDILLSEVAICEARSEHIKVANIVTNGWITFRHYYDCVPSNDRMISE